MPVDTLIFVSESNMVANLQLANLLSLLRLRKLPHGWCPLMAVAYATLAQQRMLSGTVEKKIAAILELCYPYLRARREHADCMIRFAESGDVAEVENLHQLYYPEEYGSHRVS
jgi:hypothetical protein